MNIERSSSEKNEREITVVLKDKDISGEIFARYTNEKLGHITITIKQKATDEEYSDPCIYLDLNDFKRIKDLINAIQAELDGYEIS